MRPFLTIAIPTYRRPHRLKPLLELLVSQQGISAGDWEVLVLNNCSGDSTQDIALSFAERYEFVRYHCHVTNIGAERNFRSAYDLAAGHYIWILPDDDKVVDEYSVFKVIEKLRSSSQSPAFIILNARSFSLETNQIIKERFNPIRGDIYFSNGRDILNVINDLDLIGLQRLIIRKDIFPDPFIEAYMVNAEYITCMVISLVACTKGPALYIGEPYVLFGDCDPTPWRVYWPYIALQLLPEMLLRSVKELGYTKETVTAIINKRKQKEFALILPPESGHILIFRRYKVSWSRLADLYGWSFVLSRIVAYAPRTLLRILINVKKVLKFLRDLARPRET